MKDIITKDNLSQSIELISELNLDDEDYKKIFEKFNTMLENSDIKETVEKVSKIHDLKNDEDLKEIMKRLTHDFEISDLNKIVNSIIKNEELLDFIQDLFLEKLI